MNATRTLEILNSQSKIGRKISLILAAVNEQGPMTAGALIALSKGSARPLRLACLPDFDYLILGPTGHYDLGPKGREIVMWLMGKVDKPFHWNAMEGRAGIRKLRRNGKHRI